MNNKEYVTKITSEFCDIIRQLYMDKSTEMLDYVIDDEIRKSIQLNIENFDEKLLSVYPFIYDIFFDATKKNEMYINFDELYFDFESNIARNIYNLLYDYADLDLGTLLSNGLNIKVVGDNENTKIALTKGAEVLANRNIKNMSKTEEMEK